MKKGLKNYLVLGMTLGALAAGSGAVFAASTEIKPDFPGEKGAFGAGVRPGRIFENGEAPAEFGMKFKMNDADKFSQLVSDGVISQETADKISAYMEEERAARTDGMENISVEERKSRFESGKETRVDMFENMVNAGIITQAEADAIKEAMPQRAEGRREFFNLESLVSEGVIDQATLEAIKSYTESKMEAHRAEMESKTESIKAEMEDLTSLTDEQRKAHFESIKIERPDMFEEMVSAGVITQEQADAIKAAMPQPPEK